LMYIEVLRALLLGWHTECNDVLEVYKSRAMPCGER
jgi:hypothetical protein